MKVTSWKYLQIVFKNIFGLSLVNLKVSLIAVMSMTNGRWRLIVFSIFSIASPLIFRAALLGASSRHVGGRDSIL